MGNGEDRTKKEKGEKNDCLKGLKTCVTEGLVSKVR
jgi:hypothetical protein